jgi:hypothetical protein
MKSKLIVALGAAGVLILSASFYGCLKLCSAPAEKQHAGAGMDDDASDRLKWEQRRLAAPDGRIPDNIRAKELAFAATLPTDGSKSTQRSGFSGWTNRGPWNVGGRTRAFGVDKLNENNLLAGSCSGGIWRSQNAGAFWYLVTPVNGYHGVTCLEQDHRVGHETIWYSGSGEGYGASAGAGGAYYLGNGLMKSTDNGQTWKRIGDTVFNGTTFSKNTQIIWNLACDNHNMKDSTVYAACYGAIYKSLNGGAKWTAVKSGNAYFTDVAVTDSGTVYLTLDSTGGSSKGIWRSIDGVTFTNILPPTFPKGYNRIVMGCSHSDQNVIYFLANTPHHGKKTVNYLGDPEWNSLWKYTYVSGTGSGAGGIWQDLSANLPATGGEFDKMNVQGSYDMVVRVKPDDPQTVYIGGTNLYRSSSAFTDSTHTTFIGGYEQFSHLPIINSYLNHHPDQHGLFFSPVHPEIMYSSNDGGLFITKDDMATPLVWTPLNNGYVTTMFYTVALDHASPGNDILLGGAQDNGSWYTNSANALTPWVKPGVGDGSYCAIADNQSAYYLSLQNGKMTRNIFNGSGAITSFTRIDPIGGKGYQFINPFILDPNNNNLMYLAGGKYIWRNSDLSQVPMNNTWDSISTNWVRFTDSVATTQSTITALAISTSPANRLYYGTDKMKVYRIDNANTGLPSAPTDITGKDTSATFPSTGFVSCIAVDPNNADHVMVTFSNYGVYSIFYSGDGGTSWLKVAGNLEQNRSGSGNGPSVRWASIMPVSDGYVYLVGTSTGLYATDTLKGVNTVWVQQGATSIGNTVCDMIDFRVSDGRVALATHANGIFSAIITSINDITTVKTISRPAFDLITYPNPFSDQCTVRYTLQRAARIRLTVFDETGKLVSVLSDANVQEGQHQFEMSRGTLPAGLYYISLQVGDAVESRKLMILH